MEVLDPSDDACTLLVPCDPPSLLMLHNNASMSVCRDQQALHELPIASTILAIW